jgi:hypothetical protein
MRRKALEDLTRRYVEDARRLGTQPDGLIKILQDQIALSKESGQSLLEANEHE